MIKIKTILLTTLILCSSQKTSRRTNDQHEPPHESLFELAVEHIKQHEGWHTDTKHVGYGHVIKKGETFRLPITKAQGDSILRADLSESISHFKHLGKDSLLMGVLAYNVGVYRLKGAKNIPKSNLVKKLEAGNRDIKGEFISYRKWNGKVIKSIENRRRKEIELFYIEDSHQPRHSDRDS